MAIFIGNFDEFKKFIGGYTRNIVQQKTKTPKSKRSGICEICGNKFKSLESAHIHGKEREVLMRQIFKKSPKTPTGEYVVDLRDFENKFIAEHLPIEKNIKFLCRQCHTLYDRKFDTYNLPVEYTKSSSEDFQDYIKRILTMLFEESLLSNDEIKLLKDRKYCRKTFSLDFPLLANKNDEISFSGHNRYWKTPTFADNYFACKEWWKEKFPKYEEKTYIWLNKILNEKQLTVIIEKTLTKNVKPGILVLG